MEKFKVTQTTAERTALEHLVKAGKGAARKLAHACVLLLARIFHTSIEGWQTAEIR